MRKSHGFTLIELLVVVAILGIIAAIAIPSLMGALSKAKQRRTMADMTTVGKAVSMYSIDYSFAPKLAATVPASDLTAFLTPTYLKKLPAVDGWAQQLLYRAAGSEYTLWSNGADYLTQAAPTYGATTSFAADIIYHDGEFVQWPDGMQAN